MSALTQLLDKLRQNRFLVVGRAGMDFYPDPPGDKTEHATKLVAALGGSSANIAVALTKHGGHAALVTTVSDDAIGRYCINELNNYGVDSQYVQSLAGEARTSLAIVESRVEDHQSIIYRNNAADFQMTEADINAVKFDDYCAVIGTGTALAAEPSRSATLAAFRKAKSLGMPVIFDVDYRPYSWPSPEVAAQVYSEAANLSDIIIGNDIEFDCMAGSAGKGQEKAQQLAAQSSANAPKITVYKMGHEGSITYHSEGSFQCGIFEVTALKPTGAGDAFMGGFLAALAAGETIETAVLRGSASAAIVVKNVGCAPAMPDTKTLSDFIDSYPTPPTTTAL
jgi:5-dehydro-2-deoxygluconokinase